MTKGGTTWACALALLTIAAGCGSVSSSPGDGGPDGPAAADASPDAAPPLCDPSKPFGEPTPVGGVNTEQLDSYAALSHDERTIYISRSSDDTLAGYDLWTARRSSQSAEFEVPQKMAGLNTAGPEVGASVTADGRTIYFARATTGDNTTFDIYSAFRSDTDAAFDGGSAVARINDPNVLDAAPHLSADERTIYFHSKRADGTTYKLYSAIRNSASFEEANPMDALNDGDGFDPVVSADGKTIYFASHRDNGDGPTQLDIHVATRASAEVEFGEPARLQGDPNSLDASEWPQWLSDDGCRLYFGSNRTGGDGQDDLWVVSRAL